MPDGNTPPAPTQQAPSPAIARRGRLELEFVPDHDGRTRIGRQFSSYPFHVCRPFYLDDGPARGMATLYTQSCSGGLYTEDRLVTEVEAAPGAQVHLTTQASTVIHRSTRGPACQSVHIRAGDGALVEYTPNPAILFPQAHLQSTTRLDLAPTASAILFDSFLAHDYDGGTAPFARFDNDLTVYLTDGTPVAIERFRLTGSDFATGGTGLMAGYACHGSFMAIAPQADPQSLLDNARAALDSCGDILGGVSALPGNRGLSARILARDGADLSAAMTRLWQVARVAITGHPAAPRRK